MIAVKEKPCPWRIIPGQAGKNALVTANGLRQERLLRGVAVHDPTDDQVATLADERQIVVLFGPIMCRLAPNPLPRDSGIRY